MRSAGSRDKAEARKPLARLLIGRAAMAAAMVAIATVASFAHASAAERGKSAFDVASGTSFAAAVSPDGRKIAIDLQGTIWVMPPKGGRAHPLTDRFDDAHLPSWSPDGKRIAYYAYRGGRYAIWSMRADGHDQRQLTDGAFDDREPAWSPDGRSIAFASERGGSYDIWRLDLSDGRLTQLTSGPREDRSPAWSLDGQRIVFAEREAGTSAILAVAAAGGEAVVQRTAPAGTIYEAPSLSPGGSLALVARDATSSRFEIDGRSIADIDAVFPFRAGWHRETAYVTADGHVRQIAKETARIVPFVARLETTRPRYPRARRDFTTSAPRKVLGIQHPALSPDGRTIALVALGDLYTVPASGGTPTALTRDGAMEADPAWSADGTRLAYSSDKGGGLMQLWLRDMKTGTERRLTSMPTQPLGAAWSPDGTTIAFLDYDGFFGTAGLMLVDVATGRTTRLQKTLPQPGNPTWSPDGRHVAVALAKPLSGSAREGYNQVWVVPVDTAKPPFWRMATERTLDTRGGGGPVWSPGGGRMAGIQDGLLKVWPVGPDGATTGPARTLSSRIAHYPTWRGDGGALLYQSADSLRMIDADGTNDREVPIDFTYRLSVPSGRMVVHVGGLVDAVRDATKADMDIVIDGNRIAAVVPHAAGNHEGAGRIIDAPRLTAIPGLIDFHAHPQKDTGANAHLAWLAYGVTTVRDPGNQPYDGVEDREASEAGVRIGPRIYTTGPLLEWQRVYYRMGTAVSGPDHLARELKRARALRYDLIKSYVRMPDAEQRRIIAAAHAMGVPVATHEIYPSTYSGVDSIEHLEGSSRRGFSPKEGPLGRSYEDVIGLLARSQATITPTVFGALNIYFAQHPELRRDPRMALYPAWASGPFTAEAPLPAALLAAQPGQHATLRALHAAGGRIVAGTDLVIAPNLIGELTAYVAAGRSPFTALQSATAVPARALDLDAGTLEAGKLADIVLVEGDPRRDIGALFNVRHVIANGRAFSVADLLALGAASPVKPAVDDDR
ncbi:WD40-like Beta Propeller Repeat [Sphingopyxis flava]|uniref:WD40-like Beta Propeller Repeat n=2 Tax=Sphingopyxis flava TaxID=1507287 RepID=A0A1T5FER3_9SPHN|nr:WD40-like Beta Propeller Repeat [Sphingopyxis flava]